MQFWAQFPSTFNTRGRPLSDYEIVRNEDGTYKFQVFLEQNSYLV